MVIINLKHLLQQRGMTQAELARLTGIRPSTICEMCNGLSQFVKLEHIEKICKTLQCDLPDIIKLT